MENKYYTPSIEEFHVGFEYEIYESNINREYIWKKQIFEEFTFESEINTYDGEMPFNVGFSEKRIRVKYLDSDDIESLGFVDPQYFKDADYFGYTKGNIRLYLLPSHDGIKVTKIDQFGLKWDLFSGDIKNKSELKVLLKQIGIL